MNADTSDSDLPPMSRKAKKPPQATLSFCGNALYTLEHMKLGKFDKNKYIYTESKQWGLVFV